MSTWVKEKIVLPNGEEVDAQMPVIVSASRSTDIPAFYSDWFMERLRAGYVKWFNPFNNSPLYVAFKKMRMIVFWSKNPAPMLAHLDELDQICPNYYFQFTLNDYDKEGIEPRVPKVEARVKTFQELSKRVGKDRVIWRFDPLVLTDEISVKGLLEKVQRLGDQIAPWTSRLVFSFIDIASYKKVVVNLAKGEGHAREFQYKEQMEIAEGIAELVKGWGIAAGTCAESIDLGGLGIEHNRCIDDRLMVKCFSQDEELMKFIGAMRLKSDDLFGPAQWVAAEDSKTKKDAGQRAACGCIMSKDIGEYNTCPHLCQYCYANTSNAIAMKNWTRHCECPHAETITGR